jgi:uncharacterized protein YxjI
MQYPLSLSFKIMALAPQIFVRDASENSICYVKQKMFKLKEAINVFTDEKQETQLCQMNADRIIDFSACYRFTDASGEEFGGVRRKGMRSIWKAHYDIIEGDETVMTISEDNAWVKVADAVLGDIAVIGMFSGYFFNPSYTIKRTDGTEVMRLKKQKSFWEGKFILEKLTELDETEELRALMAIIMATLLERTRG